MRIGIFTGFSTDSRVRATVESFVEGIRHLEEDFFVAREYQPCDVAVVWGISSKRAIERTAYRDVVRRKQPNTICLERGFVRRDEYYSVGWYNTGGLGDYCVAGEVPCDRWAALGVELQGWQLRDGVLLLCGQVPHDTSVQHIDYPRWLQAAANELRKRTNTEVIYRPHPLFADLDVRGVSRSSRTLAEDFRRAKAVITFNSTTAVESVIAGIPTYSFDRRSLAYEVSSHSFKTIEKPPTFAREQWAHRLAYKQWHIDEIACGKPWLHLKRRLQAQ
ncbi:MAG: hypothetical protein WBN40_10805 [Pseudomonadales bacterium]